MTFLPIMLGKKQLLLLLWTCWNLKLCVKVTFFCDIPKEFIKLTYIFLCVGKKVSQYSSAVPHTNAITEAQELLVRLCEKFDVRTPQKRDMNILLDKMEKESRVHSNQIMVFAIFTLKGNLYCSPDIIIKKVVAVGDAEDKKLETKIENAMKSIRKYLSRVEVDLAKDRFPDVFGAHSTPTEGKNSFVIVSFT